MIPEEPDEKDLERAKAAEKRRHMILALIVGLFFFALAVAILT